MVVGNPNDFQAVIPPTILYTVPSNPLSTRICADSAVLLPVLQ
jgi:hypothetical protein